MIYDTLNQLYIYISKWVYEINIGQDDAEGPCGKTHKPTTYEALFTEWGFIESFNVVSL